MVEQEVFLQWVKLFAIYLALAFGLKAVNQLWWRPRRIEKHFSKQGIKGPPYRFFIGNAKEMERMMKKAAAKPTLPLSHNIIPRVLSFYHYWKKVYGPTFLLWFGPTARLVVSDPDLVREVLVSKSELYEKMEQPPLVRQLEGDGLLELNGEKWALHRKIIAPSFLMENLKLLVPEVSKSILDMFDKWEVKLDNGDEVEIEVSECFQTLMEDIISKAAFGCSYEEGRAIYQLQAQQMLLAALAFQKVFIPGYRFLPTKMNMKSWRLDKEVRKSLVKLISRRKQNDASKNDDDAPRDLLGLMIRAAANSSSSNFSVRDIIEECKGFFFAGKETTSSLLTWTTILLAMHPRWQELAREEVLTVCGPRDIPTKDDLVKLKKLNMIVNEVLRLYSPTVAIIRRAKVDAKLGKHVIPRGTEILIPILGIHHDQAVWGTDATKFNPDRFSEDPAKGRSRPATFLPFGLGLRNCIGQNLAILQAKLTIALILQRFSFALAPSYQHAPTVLLMLYPQYGAPIIFKKLHECPPGPPDRSTCSDDS